MKTGQEKMLVTRLDAFINEMAGIFKTSTDDVETAVKNTLNHRDWQRDNWASERQAEIGR